MTCTCSASILDPLCPVEAHRVMAKAARIASGYVDRAMALAIDGEFTVKLAPYVVQSIAFRKPCTCPSIAADPFCPIEEHHASAAPGDGQPLAPVGSGFIDLRHIPPLKNGDVLHVSGVLTYELGGEPSDSPDTEKP